MTLEVVRDLERLRTVLEGWRLRGRRVALVPTMGALHPGHAALVARAQALADRVVTSIFVNPTQFAPSEDLDRYPRDEAGDLALLDANGCDLAWMPPQSAMYPEGAQTWVTVDGLSRGLDGEHRPGFFRGVATVVAKLLCQVRPDIAVFGEKDYQQLKVVERLVLDLGLPTAIAAHPTVREVDGLAMSSRNAYLDPAQRAAAPLLHRALQATAARLRAGEAGALAAAGRELAAAGFAPVDYLELRDAATLEPLAVPFSRPARLLAAAWLGSTRLIDNVPVEAGEHQGRVL